MVLGSSKLLESGMTTPITPQERRRLAKRVGLSEQYIYQCLTGRREMSAWEATRVERATEGVVTRQMLCRGSWASIWSELVEVQV